MLNKKNSFSLKKKFILIASIQISMILIIAYSVNIISIINDINKFSSYSKLSTIYLKNNFNKFYDDTSFGDSDDANKVKDILYKKSEKLSLENGGIYEILENQIQNCKKLKNYNKINRYFINKYGNNIFININNYELSLNKLIDIFNKQQSNTIILAEFKISGDKELDNIKVIIKDLENNIDILNNNIENILIIVIFTSILISFLVSFFSINIIKKLNTKFKETLNAMSISNNEIFNLSNILDKLLLA